MSLKQAFETAVVAASFIFSGAESAKCVNAAMDVVSTADAEALEETLKCTGGGEFNVAWYGRVTIQRAFEVAGGISLNVTGNYDSGLSIDDVRRTATIVGDRMNLRTGMFLVSGASSLTLNNLVLQGGYSDTPYRAGAVEAQGTGDGKQTVNVFDCQFEDNTGLIAGVCRWRTIHFIAKSYVVYAFDPHPRPFSSPHTPRASSAPSSGFVHVGFVVPLRPSICFDQLIFDIGNGKIDSVMGRRHNNFKPIQYGRCSQQRLPAWG